MRLHNDFTLYFRVIPSGKRVVYYHAYDENGRRVCGKSTGETTMTAARLKCNSLLREGKLVSKKDKILTFAEYAQGWWEWETCEYLKKRRKRYNLTQSYADTNKKNLRKHLLPFFGDMPVQKITKDDVERFFDWLIEKKYRNTTINGFYGTLKTMLIEAVERNIIPRDPTDKMVRLLNDRKALRIITPEEFKKLFTGDWRRVWENDRINYTANKLAALTGMRVSEVLGLKGGFVYDEHIYLCMQFDEYGYRPTKTKDKHNIPLTENFISELKELKRMNGDGFIFSMDGGATPICRKTMYTNFHRALRNIGLSDDEISERHLHLHGWRHFFNTEMLKSGMTTKQAQAITGHKSDRMTEWYCHFDISQFGKAKEVQDSLLKPDITEVTEIAGRASVLPFPAKDNEPQQKQA
jgi:integrase